MLEDKPEVIQTEGSAPRWIGIVVVVLAIVSLAALGVGWTASNKAASLQQALAAQQREASQSGDVLNQRLEGRGYQRAAAGRTQRGDRQDETHGNRAGPGASAGQEDQGRRR